jgi:phosphoribosylformimino-5-aminoimidazole carboxamide ribotide isomerase
LLKYLNTEQVLVDIIPAVDLMGGLAVRLRQGKKVERTTYYEDPVVPAAAFAEAGARFMHVVDLDGAFEGGSKNLNQVRRICAAVGDSVTVELGGGLRSLEQMERAFGCGVSRVILGTAILADPELLERALERFGAERIVVGIDARDGRVAIRGWEEETDASAVEVARSAEAAGAVRLIYTDIAVDGMLAGPNIKALEQMVRACGMKVIASGGISSLEHVRTVCELENSGVEAMIIGKALYEGTLDLAAVLAATASSSG